MGTGLHGKTRVRDAAEKRGYRSKGGRDSPVRAGEEWIRQRGEEWSDEKRRRRSGERYRVSEGQRWCL